MYIVSADEAKAMLFSSDFYKYAHAQGIENPFEVNQTRAERDAWIRMRDEYIARRCFYEIGYDMFLAHTKPGDTYDISYMRDLDEFVPCRSADRQCAMFCKNIGGNCNEENL